MIGKYVVTDTGDFKSNPYPFTNVDGPTYLDFITPDDVFDKGPDAVKAWQEAERAGITNPPPPQQTLFDLPLAQAISSYWGDRCSDFDPDCPCCKAWASYDRAHPPQEQTEGGSSNG